jgi:hypothetical protein
MAPVTELRIFVSCLLFEWQVDKNTPLLRAHLSFSLTDNEVERPLFSAQRKRGPKAPFSIAAKA